MSFWKQLGIALLCGLGVGVLLVVTETACQKDAKCAVDSHVSKVKGK